MPIERIDADLITRYIASCSSFRAKATVYGTLSTMRGFGDYLVRQGLWTRNPLRWMKGPNFLLVMGPSGKLTMGKSLGQWALNCFIVSFMTAYVARHAHLEGAAAIEVARITGTVSIMGYTLATMTESIWKWRPWSSTFLVLMDGVIYGLGTAACFALLWPSGS